MYSSNKKIPKNSMFTVKNGMCPKGATSIGQIGILDSKNINNEKFKTNSCNADDECHLLFQQLYKTI